MSSLKSQFDLATEHLKTSHTKFSTQHQLKFYGLYKQATEGPAKGKPPRLDLKKKKMFSAWESIGPRMTKEQAMKKYIQMLQNLDSEFQLPQTVVTEAAPKEEVKESKTRGLFKKKVGVLRRADGLGALEKPELEEEFENAAEFVRNTNRFKDFKGQQILLYSFYKQATEGVCHRKKPSVFAGREKYARWRAWRDLFAMSKEEAMRKYIAQVLKTVPNFDGKPDHTRVLLDQESLVGEPQPISDLGESEIFDLVTEVTPATLIQKFDQAKASGSPVFFITGASGFIGKHLVDTLSKSDANSQFVFLSRPSSRRKLVKTMIKRNGSSFADRFLVASSNLGSTMLGLESYLVETIKNQKNSSSSVKFFHLAAKYDFQASTEENLESNVNSTRNVVGLCNYCGVKLEYTSSIAVAGDSTGIFMESSFEEGQKFGNSYAMTKFEAEKIVREESKDFTIYRPGVVVGHSKTGEADKIDGPYYFFKLLQKLRGYLPQALVLPFVDSTGITIVPVDYVVEAMAHISSLEAEKIKSKCFHLVDAWPLGMVDSLNVFARAAHAPTFSARLTTVVMSLLPRALQDRLEKIPILWNAPGLIAKNVFGIPESLLSYLNSDLTYDDSDTQEMLAGSGIKCPRLQEYAWKLWDYYERHMDLINVNKPLALEKEIAFKNVLITGATDGIGLTLAKNLMRSRANVIVVARNAEKVEKTVKELEKLSNYGNFVKGFVADLSEEKSTNEMIDEVLKTLKHIDVLINNAGRSIRRSADYQVKGTGRFHDFERTINLNYYGSLRCILGFMPIMRERKQGHIINISSIGVVTNAPRFGAYVASKAALDGFTRCVAGEVAADNVFMTTVYMPLVATKMINSKGNNYNEGYNRVYSVEQACDLISEGIIEKERIVSPMLGRIVSLGYMIFPSAIESILNVMYQLEPENAPPDQEASESAQGDKEQLKAVAALLKGAF